MKKLLAGILTAALVLSVGVTSALAATPSQGKHFVDADGNGICDNRNTSCGYIDANDDGICDRHSANNEQEEVTAQQGYGKSTHGKQFTGNHSNGVCDNKTNGNFHNNGARRCSFCNRHNQ